MNANTILQEMFHRITPRLCSSLGHPVSCRRKCTIIDGKIVFENVLKAVKKDVDAWVEQGNRRPCLTALTAGYDPSSMSYVKIKKKAAKFVGIDCDIVELTSGYNDDDIIRIIRRLNESESVDGILVQLPLYPHNKELNICDAVHHSKDVDGTSSSSMGNLCNNKDMFAPCTSLAVHHILDSIRDLNFCGKHAVVIGRSKHVGLPIAMLLHSSERKGDIRGFNMTTSIVHRHTPPKLLSELCESADVLVSAAGIPGLVTSDMVKAGAVVIDVGITKVEDPKTGKRLFKGDIDFAEVKKKAMYLTSVPGGVGPVTVGMLMKNVLKAAKLQVAARNVDTPIDDQQQSEESNNNVFPNKI
uniref:methenyltetrahydrofolate cyclohydrolase n=1 Tax=Lygus hesperus TaxID=30085 RepID=A0A146L8H1_LYGHE